MWNRWNERLCLAIFGDIGFHIWGKWLDCCDDCGHIGAPAMLYAGLDQGNRSTLVRFATTYYNCKEAVAV